MKANCDYGVVILNYKTPKYSLLAAESVINSSVNENFQICIVDGGSNDIESNEILGKCLLKNTNVVFLKENKGYAHGNNEGAKYLIKNYNPKYIVIMNPDVEITIKGTIEGVISEIERNENVVGGQPLVNTPARSIEPNCQINIRRVFEYKDCLIDSAKLLKIIFRKRYEKLLYLNDMPYMKPIRYQVPSGAFFIINSEWFQKIGMFDEDTFLYNEELILGYKLSQMNKEMILVPDFMVIHEGGKSTGSGENKVSIFSFKEHLKSIDIYLNKYLKVPKIKRKIVQLLALINYYLKYNLFKR